MMKHKWTHALAAAAIAAAAPVLVSCSSGSNTPKVAALGSSATASAAATSTLSPYQRGLQYSACMRAHGVPDFPDPQQNAGGGGVTVRLTGGPGLNPDSAQFKAAEQACQSLRPGGGNDAGGGRFDPTKVTAWADCVRKHGVPNFPDPTDSGTGMSINLTGTGIDPNTLQSAISACTSLSPGGALSMTNNGAGG
jgi:hypothetical protein